MHKRGHAATVIWIQAFWSFKIGISLYSHETGAYRYRDIPGSLELRSHFHTYVMWTPDKREIALGLLFIYFVSIYVWYQSIKEITGIFQQFIEKDFCFELMSKWVSVRCWFWWWCRMVVMHDVDSDLALHLKELARKDLTTKVSLCKHVSF